MTLQHSLVDKPAPTFSIPDSNGEMFKFPPEQQTGHFGKPVVLFFYPESGSYGCTREACQFRDALVEKEIYKRSHVLVVGVSSDPVEKQKAFVEKYKLQYPVLSDTDRTAHKAYHIGRGILGLVDARTTFVIDHKGIVKGVLNATMNFNAHVKFVTKELESVGNPDAVDVSDDHEGVTEDRPESAERDELGRVAQAVCA